MRLEVSPSSRATCRTCETRIELGTIRVAATSLQNDQFVERYHHLICVVEDDPNGAIVAMLAAPADLRTSAERLLTGHRAFLLAVAQAAAGKQRQASASTDEFDDETETLIAKLAANPRDPALLSVLQDQLQEHGLPRGELIALELAKAPETARVVEIKRQLWPVVKDVRVTWGTGFLRTMSVHVRDQASSGAAVQALKHPSARLLEELSLQSWVGPLPAIPQSLKRLEFQWCDSSSSSIEGLPRLQHLQLNHVEDAEQLRSTSLTSLGFGPDVVSVPLAKSLPRLQTLVISSRDSVPLLARAGLLEKVRVLVLFDVWDNTIIDALEQTGCTWDHLVWPRLRPNDTQRKALLRLSRRPAVSRVSGVPDWVSHSSRPEWGVGRVRSRTATAVDVEFDSGVRTFAPTASVLTGVDVLDEEQPS